MDELFNTTGLLLTFIVQLLMLIVFLRMAWNIGKIKKHIVRDSSGVLWQDAKKLEFIGKKQEALESYLEYLYLINNDLDMDGAECDRKITKATSNIERLGGTIPGK